MKLFSEAQIRKFEQIISEAEGRPMRIDRAELSAEVSKVTKAKEATSMLHENEAGDRLLDGSLEGRGGVFSNIIFPGATPVSKAKTAKDEDEDDEMSAQDRKARGVAAKDADEGDEDEGEEDEAKDADHDEADEPDDDEDDKPKRGRKTKTAKVSFADVIIGPATREFPLEQQERARQPRGVDDGEDSLGRSYESAVMDRIAGEWSRSLESEQSMIPNAGAGVTGRMSPNSGFAPMPSGEGNNGRVGGEDRGVRSGGPVQGYIDDECGVVRAGDFAVMNPGNSGLQSAADFMRPEPATSVAKRRVGVFKDVVFGAKGDNADGFLG